MRFLRQSVTGLFLMAAALGLLVYAGSLVSDAIETRMSREPRVPQVRERVFAVEVVTVRPETVSPVLTAFGEVQSRRTLDVRAAASGTVVGLSERFVEGGNVAAGEVLVRIDPANAQSALDRSETDLMDSRAEAREAERALTLARDELEASREQAVLRERALQRQLDLEERGVGTAATVETAELAASTARAAVLTRRQAVAQAEARLDQAATRISRAEIALAEAQRRLDDTVIRAGFSGTLSEVTLVEGGLVSVNERLARLIDPAALEVAIRLSTTQYARLLDAQGQLIEAPVTARLDLFGTGLTAAGRLGRDSGSVGEGQTGRQVFATLDDPRGMKPGDFVTVEIEEPPLDRVVRLPAAALDSSGEVLVIGPGDRLEAMPVTLLRRQGDEVLVRAPGLSGAQVVSTRTPLLGAGVRVRPLEGTTAREPEPEAMLELSEERRAKLVAFIEASTMIPSEARARILSQLQQSKVPAQVVERIESRMGG